MSTMAATTRITFDTLSFVKRLEAVGVETRAAEVQAQLQMELQSQILEKQEQSEQQFLNKFAEYEPLLDEIKITKGDFATKSDIFALKSDIFDLKSDVSMLKSDISALKPDMSMLRTELKSDISELNVKTDNLQTKLILKLGGIMAACTTVIAALVTCVSR